LTENLRSMNLLFFICLPVSWSINTTEKNLG